MHLQFHYVYAGSLHVAGCRDSGYLFTAICNQVLVSGCLQAPFRPALALPGCKWCIPHQLMSRLRLPFITFGWLPAGAFQAPQENNPIAIFTSFVIGPMWCTTLLALGEAGPSMQSVCLLLWSAAPSSASPLFSPAALASF